MSRINVGLLTDSDLFIREMKRSARKAGNDARLLRQRGSHQAWQVGAVLVTIVVPRTKKGTALKNMKELERALGEGWLR